MVSEKWLNFVCEDCYVSAVTDVFPLIPNLLDVSMPEREAIAKGWKHLPSSYDGSITWFCPKHAPRREQEIEEEQATIEARLEYEHAVGLVGRGH